jgi:hypothetical protein
MGELFFDFPDELVRVHVLSCLSLKDIVNVDTAVLCGHSREIFHNCLKNLYIDNETVAVSNASALLLQKWGMKAASIRICRSVTDEVVPALSEVANSAVNIELDKEVNRTRCPLLLEHLQSRISNSLVHSLRLHERQDQLRLEVMPNLLHLSLPQLTHQLTTGTWSARLQELEIAHWSATTGDYNDLTSVVMHCPALRSLTFMPILGFSRDAAEAIARNCPQLESLNVQHCGCQESWLEPIARGCPRLHTLRTRGYWASGTEDFILRALPYLPALTDLDCEDCPVPGHELLSLLAVHCPMLRSLALHMHSLSYEGVGEDLCRLPLLTCLGDEPIIMGPGLPRSAFREICAAVPHLQKMSLYLQWDQAAGTMEPSGLGQLRILRLCCFEDVGEHFLCGIIHGNPLLSEISFLDPSSGNIGDEVMLAVAASCRHLTVLRLPGGMKVTDAGVVAVG